MERGVPLTGDATAQSRGTPWVARDGDNGGVSQATSPRSRAIAAGRRLTGAAELPVTGAVVLALLALIQVTGGVVSSGPAEPVLGGDLALVDQVRRPSPSCSACWRPLRWRSSDPTSCRWR